MFHYQGRDGAGNLQEGQLEAKSSQDAMRQLDQKGIRVIQIRESKSPSTKKNLNWDWLLQLGNQRVTLDEQILFCRQMYSLSKAGIPVIRAFNGLAESTKNRHFADILRAIGDSLQKGNDLGTSMAQHKTFSSLFIAMVRMGESTGRLDLAFKQLIGHLELEKETKRRIKTATRYPTMVMVAITIAILIINVMVVPQFARIFSKFGSDLPLPTKILITSSHAMTHYWWVFILVIGSSLFAWWQWTKTGEGELFKDRLKLRLPIIGSIVTRITLSRFTRPFAMMLESGVPMIQAIGISARTVNNAYVGQAILGMQQNIEQGESLLRAAAASGMFNPILLQMMAVGEETGNVSGMLVDISDFYDEEIEYELARLSQNIEPIILVIMGIMVMILATGVFLPMWDLVSVVN